MTIVGHLLVGNHVSFKVCTFHMSAVPHETTLMLDSTPIFAPHALSIFIAAHFM